MRQEKDTMKRQAMLTTHQGRVIKIKEMATMEVVKESKTKEMQSTEEFWAKKPPKDCINMDAWPGVARGRIGGQYRHERPGLAGSLDRRRRRDKGEYRYIKRS